MKKLLVLSLLACLVFAGTKSAKAQTSPLFHSGGNVSGKWIRTLPNQK
jgi:hypothetical protein